MNYMEINNIIGLDYLLNIFINNYFKSKKLKQINYS